MQGTQHEKSGDPRAEFSLLLLYSLGQVSTMLWAPSEGRGAAWGLPGLCSSAAAMPSLSSRLWLLRKRPFSCRLHHQSGPSITSLSSFVRGSLLFLKQVLRLQWPLKPLEILAKIFLGLCLGYSDSVRRGASLRNLQLMISVPLPCRKRPGTKAQKHPSFCLSKNLEQM